MTWLIRCFFFCAFLWMGSHGLRAQAYYAVQQIDQAKAEAHMKHLPIAWLSSPMVYLGPQYANEAQGSPAELTALALRTLQGQAVIVFQNADIDLPIMPANMVDRIETKDEGDNLPHGWHYTAPKIIYTDPDLKTFFGCTLAPDLRSDREAAINIALLHIRNDPQAQALINSSPVAPTSPLPASAPSPAQAATPSPSGLGVLGTFLTMMASGSLFIYTAGALLVLLAVIAFLAWRSRS